MSLALERNLTTVGDAACQPINQHEDSRLNITVIFTSMPATIAALDKAGSLAEDLGARITLVVPQVVPYPLPLSSPPVLLDFQERRLREIAAAARTEIRVQLYLCRDERDTLAKVLLPHSLVVIGGQKKWWPTKAQRLARRLRAAHAVVFAEMK